MNSCGDNYISSILSAMSILAGVAGGLHVLESLYTFYLTRFTLKMKPATVALWTINILIAGIFGKS